MSRGIDPMMVGNDYVTSNVTSSASIGSTLPLPAPKFVQDPDIITTDPKPRKVSHRKKPHHRKLFIRSALIILALIIVSAFSFVSYLYTQRAQISSLSLASQIAVPLKVQFLNKPITRQLSTTSVLVSNPILSTSVDKIANQKINIKFGAQTVSVAPTEIKQWLKITKDKYVSTISVNNSAIDSYIGSLVTRYSVAPTDQVVLTQSDNATVVNGSNGTQFIKSPNLSGQISNNLLGSNGANLIVPSQTIPYKTVNNPPWSKFIEVDLTTKQLYAYQNGKLVNTFPVSAGKPSTPTPTGTFHIWAKLTSQTMTGPGYVQPNVPWVNYFNHDGDAIHGNYWRPASVFGNVNTSHGCVGLQDDNAEWIFNWAPIGTTVIIHN